MFWKRRPLQSKSEIWLRNISMGFLVLYLGLFMVIPMIMAAVGSLHQWNPLNETWRWLGIENYIRMFSYPSLLAVYDKYRGILRGCRIFSGSPGLSVAYALNSKLMKCRTFFRTFSICRPLRLW